MPLNDPYTVSVRVPVTTPLGLTMNKFREWLDSQKIQPREFKIDSTLHYSTITIGFGTVEDAERFRAEFETVSAAAEWARTG